MYLTFIFIFSLVKQQIIPFVKMETENIQHFSLTIDQNNCLIISTAAGYISVDGLITAALILLKMKAKLKKMGPKL